MIIEKNFLRRCWNVSDNIERIDVGSYTEFLRFIRSKYGKPESYRDSLFESLMENEKL